mgnify:CR=1 FL=1
MVARQWDALDEGSGATVEIVVLVELDAGRTDYDELRRTVERMLGRDVGFSEFDGATQRLLKRGEIRKVEGRVLSGGGTIWAFERVVA